MSVLLTRREQEVLAAVFDMDGDLYKAAERLCIGRGTLRGYLHNNIYPKLMVNSLAGAIRVSLAMKLLSLSDSIARNPPNLLK